MTSSSVAESAPRRPAAQGGTQAVDRAAALLTYIVEADHPVTFAEATEALGLARSTTSRLLAALENNRLLERCAPGEYVGGPLFVLYAARHDRNAQLARLARPTLERIGELTGEDVHLAVANGNQVAHIANVDSTYLLGARDWSDIEIPPHSSALGKVLLAWDAHAAAERPARDTDRPHPAHPRRPRCRPRAGAHPRLRGHPRRARGRARRCRRTGLRAGQGRGRRRRGLRTHGAARATGSTSSVSC